MSKKIGVIVFPGSNCDHDTYHAMKHVMNADTKFLWHKENNVEDVDLILVPGGFSYGDYLRSGAIAKFSPIMKAVKDFADKGKPVLGICNGFQILMEAGLLPGVTLHNKNLRYTCKSVHIRVENTRSVFTSGLEKNRVLEMPVSHGEGNYFVDDAGLSSLEENGQIAFRYCDSEGNVTPEANFNGSVSSIAGVTNRGGNVLGMMPHPERAMEKLLGSTDGAAFFESILHEMSVG